MFANFLYFVIALLILSLYEPAGVPPFSLGQALLLFVLIGIVFAVYTRYQFQRMIASLGRESQMRLDRRFGQITTRHSILALFLLAVDVWALHLPAFLDKIQWLRPIPTLGTLVFLLVFIGYLTLVWYFSYAAHRRIYQTDISRRDFVYSNIAFSVPILIPWLLLSTITDILQILPFAWPKQVLNTTFGQIGTFLLFLGLAAVFAPMLIQRFWRCYPLEPGEQRQRIENLCRQAGVAYADIVYWPIFGGRMITAGVMGLVGRFRYILVTDALLRLLRPEEIDQVIAHEIGHVKRSHLLYYMLFFIGFLLVWYMIFSFRYAMMDIIFQLSETLSMPPHVVQNIILAVFLIVSAVLYFRYVFGYFMRNFERQADIFVFQLFTTAIPLIATFDKIVLSSGQPADKPNWHHFSIQERVDYLRQCETSPAWIARHNRKVRKSMLIYIAAALLLGSGLYYFDANSLASQTQTVDFKYLELYLNHKQSPSAKDAPYHFLLGDYYLIEKNYAKAAAHYELGLSLEPDSPMKEKVLSRLGSAYFESHNMRRAYEIWERALALAPDDPEALNNLAWLLASVREPDLRDPKRALELVQKAITTGKFAHIMDTYAMALFVNGRIEEAIKAEEKALEMTDSDKKTFRKQLAKFKAALEQQ
jgi:Zn-dependent protease with chaperone function